MYIGAVLRLAAKVVENLESSIIKAMDTQPMGSKKREKNKLLSSLLVIVFFVLIVGGIYYYSSNSAKPAEKTREDVVLTLEPSTTTVKAGDTFTASLQNNTKIIVPEGKAISLILNEQENLAKATIIPIPPPPTQKNSRQM